MNKLTLDFEFDKNLQKKKPSIDAESNILHLWADIKDFIINRSDVEVLHNEDVNNVDFNTSNPFIFKLYNDHLQNIKRVLIKKSTDIETESYLKNKEHYFFTDNTKLGFKPSDLGFMKFDSKDLWKRWNYKEDYKFSYRNEAMDFSLEKIEQFKHPSKEIILIDRYILSDRKKLVYNLKSILNAIIIPSNEMKLFIFSSSSDIDKSFNMDVAIIEDLLSHELCNIFKNISVHVFLDYRSKKIIDKISGKEIEIFHREHSRYLLTNYYVIKSGQGFHIYNKLNEKNKSYSDEITFSPLCHSVNQIVKRNVFESLYSIVKHESNSIKNNLLFTKIFIEKI